MDLAPDAGGAQLSEQDTPFWLTPPAYWLPRHYPTSAWLTHGPFASWLTDALHPAVIVELGTHFGYSCFAFAEAAKRLGLSTTINALDSWVGDDHAGFYGDDVYRYVESVVRADYPDSVRMVRGLFTESREEFADRTVDILHIDGRHAYEDVLADYSEWKGVVRDGGVILFHDIAERDKDFGVWRLWSELAEPGSSFAFDHGHGLGVLGVGDDFDAPLLALFEADPVTAQQIRADFQRLGEAAARQSWLETLPVEIDQIRAEVRARAAHEDHLSSLVAARQQEIDALRSSRSWRLTAPLRAVGKLRARRD